MGLRTIMISSVMTIMATLAFASGTEEMRTYEASLEGVRRLQIDNGSVDVDIQHTSGDLRYSGAVHENRSFNVMRRGDEARITVDGRIGLNVGFFSEGITIYLPDSSFVEVNAGSGDVSVEGVDGIQLVHSSDSGNIRVRKSSGNFELTTTSGDQDHSRVSGALALETTSGDIDLADVSGVARLSTLSGDISADALRVTEDMYCSTTSGDIDIAFRNPARELRFVLRSASGDLEVDDYDSEDSLHIGEGELLVQANSTSGDQRFRTQ